jgi:hypothetical protein
VRKGRGKGVFERYIMKAKKYRLLTGLFAVCAVVLFVGSVFGQYDPFMRNRRPAEIVYLTQERHTLRGLTGIYVGIGSNTEAAEYGLGKEVLQTDVELQLRRYGVRVMSGEGVGRMPELYVQATVKQDALLEGAIAVAVKVEFRQDVILLRDPTKHCAAVTWQDEVVMLVGTEGIRGVRDDLSDLLDRFINDYLAANPEAISVTRGMGLDELKRGVKYWVKCVGSECEQMWQMDRKDYFQYLREHQDPMSLAAPAIVCPTCSKESGYRAEKCANCALVFVRGGIPHDFADRCPQCGRSKTEDDRKASREAEREAAKEEERRDKEREEE